MKAIILNYINLSVDVAIIPESVFEGCEQNTSEYAYRIEEYLTNTFGYDSGEINYMTADDDEPIPVYHSGSDELTDEPIATL